MLASFCGMAYRAEKLARQARSYREGVRYSGRLDRNTMMCTIYKKRPLICREFEMGDVECLNERLGITTAYR